MFRLFTKTCKEGGAHKFVNFLVKQSPPPIGGEGISYYMLEMILEKGSYKVFEIRCEYCGKKPEDV